MLCIPEGSVFHGALMQAIAICAESNESLAQSCLVHHPPSTRTRDLDEWPESFNLPTSIHQALSIYPGPKECLNAMDIRQLIHSSSFKPETVNNKRPRSESETRPQIRYAPSPFSILYDFETLFAVLHRPPNVERVAPSCTR